MNEQDFEGTIVLEKLALIEKVEDFFEAIDNDDMSKVAGLMRKANIDSETISITLKKISESND